MIELIEGLPDGVVGIEAVGTVTSEDYRRVAVPAIERARENHEKPGELRPFSNAERAEAESWFSADLE